MANKEKPLLTPDLRRIVAELPQDLRGLRDRALLLAGLLAAFADRNWPRSASKISRIDAGWDSPCGWGSRTRISEE